MFGVEVAVTQLSKSFGYVNEFAMGTKLVKLCLRNRGGETLAILLVRMGNGQGDNGRRVVLPLVVTYQSDLGKTPAKVFSSNI